MYFTLILFNLITYNTLFLTILKFLKPIRIFCQTHSRLRCWIRHIALSNKDNKLVVDVDRKTIELYVSSYVMILSHLKIYPKRLCNRIASYTLDPFTIVQSIGPTHMNMNHVFNVEYLTFNRGILERISFNFSYKKAMA